MNDMQLTNEQRGVRGTDPYADENTRIIFESSNT